MSVSSSSSSNDEDDIHDDSSMRVPPFLPDQRVFATDESSGALYEAIVRKTAWNGQHWTFLVHYLGWNARWDKWLDETQVFPDNAEMRQKVQKQQQKQEETKRKRSIQEETSSRKKRVERGPSFAEYCELPFSLKTILVEDREKVMRLGFDALDCDVTNWRPVREVHQLPARVTVRQILNHYVKCKKKEQAGDEVKAKQAEEKARAFVEDLAKLFDETLPVCLLYQPERAQHAAIQAHPELSRKRKSDLYGCEFLLRFFVRLPVLLEEVSNRKELGTQLADLILLLQKNRRACFKAKYREPKDEELNDWEKALKDGAAPIAMDE